ncbi:shikimate dehydrogenase [Bacillus sp. FJAT-44742]|uniref:shikimate dehydrogenase n=1 Tax=Bacillus sp. FJAT-44742 TaxID=2014005 RepID=UPI000C24478D|nr:shikimate dehydrogenase [Bacillus sp. FJAT-44742]
MGNLYVLFGHPVGHSMSPIVHNEQFSLLNMPHHYHAIDVEPGKIKEAVEAIKALSIAGANVTVPHKVEIMKHLDHIDEEARIIGAVNTIVNENGVLTGYNTDGQGYLESLLEVTGPDISDYKILVIGAGGASRAVVTVLCRYGVNDLMITNRTQERAEALSKDCGGQVISKEKAEGMLSEFDVIINTTSIGMSPNTDEMPMSVEGMKPKTIASDLIYNPLQTRWLAEAEKRGAVTHSGIGMFVRQGALAFKKWTGQEADLEIMTKTVLQQLGGKND